MTLDELIAALQRIRDQGGEGAGKMPVAILGGEALLKIYSNGRLAALLSIPPGGPLYGESNTPSASASSQTSPAAPSPDRARDRAAADKAPSEPQSK